MGRRNVAGAAFLLGCTVQAVIVKEKLMAEADAAPAGVAFMVKRAQPKFRESGG